jgi:hypothetical protein
MKKSFIALLLLSTMTAFSQAEISKTPMSWTSIHTNLINKWKSDFKAPDGVYFDKDKKTVNFLIEACGVRENDILEFFVIGPMSDRAYESFSVSIASPQKIADAVSAIGVKRGVPTHPFLARFWPQGEKLDITIAPYNGKLGERKPFKDYILDKSASEVGDVFASKFVWTGGELEANGKIAASTNIPCSVMSFYSLGQSLLLLNGIFDQSSVYGRFAPVKTFAPGDLFEICLSWDGKSTVQDRTVKVNQTNIKSILNALRIDSKSGDDIFVKVAFDDGVTVAEAKKMAEAFAILDGSGIKLNGSVDGQFYVKAFLPDETWRNREGRIFQPFEIHLKADGTKSFVFIEEDWSGEGMDPVLKPKETLFKDWKEVLPLIAKTGKQGDKVFVLLIYAHPAMDVKEVLPALSLYPRINTFYIFNQ